MEEKILLRARQQEAWMRLMATCSELAHCLPDAEKWFRDIGIWAQVKGADGILVSALKKASQSIDDRQYRSMRARIENYMVYVGTKPVSNSKELYVMPVADLDVMCGAIANDTCKMCVLDKGEQRKCVLRRVLEGLPHHVKDSNTGECPFAICEKE